MTTPFVLSSDFVGAISIEWLVFRGSDFSRDAYFFTLLRSAASLPCFARLRRASHLSLCGQRNMAQRKATPHSRLPHSPCAPGARVCSGVRRQSIRGLASNWPTSCGPSFGQSLHSPAASDGTLIARIVRAKATAKSQSQSTCHPPSAPSPASPEKEASEQSQSVPEPASSLLRRMRSEWGPYAVATWRRESPQGGREGSRPVCCQHKDVLSANLWSRVAQSEGRSPESAASGWPFFWLLFFGHSKKSNSPAPEAGEKRHGCRAPKERALVQQIHWAPASVKSSLPRACRRSRATIKLIGSFARKTRIQNPFARRAGQM